MSTVLSLSPKTVEAHVGSIMTKLDIGRSRDVNRRVLAVPAHLRGVS
ncbi:LuxR C-terminal-related transcriptional regulator [Streptomyces sp. NPDC051940]